MRPDMPKLLVERPRGGWRGRATRRKPRQIRDLESLPTHLSIARDTRKTKWLSENLAPLQRLLDKRVGRAWDRVYAEIRAHLRCDDPIQLHVLQHLWQFVERHAVLIEGVPYRLGSSHPLSGYGHRFYVCPTTGVLVRVPWEPRAQTDSTSEAAAARRKRKRRGSRR